MCCSFIQVLTTNASFGRKAVNVVFVACTQIFVAFHSYYWPFRWEIIAFVHCEIQQLATAVINLCSAGKYLFLHIYPRAFNFGFISIVFTMVLQSQGTFHIRHHPTYSLHRDVYADIYCGKWDYIWLYLGYLKCPVNI